MEHKISNNEDILDIRDIIEQFETLESEIVTKFNEQSHEATDSDDDLFKAWLHQNRHEDEQSEEFSILLSLLEDLKGYGGDEQWRGDWYPLTLIRDSYFEKYAQELAEDIGAIDRNAHWPNNCIDWERASRELEIDYTTVEFDGVTYLYR